MSETNTNTELSQAYASLCSRRETRRAALEKRLEQWKAQTTGEVDVYVGTGVTQDVYGEDYELHLLSGSSGVYISSDGWMDYTPHGPAHRDLEYELVYQLVSDWPKIIQSAVDHMNSLE